MVWQRGVQVKWAAILISVVCATFGPAPVRAEPRTVTVEPGSQPAPPASQPPGPIPAAPQPPAPTIATNAGQSQQPPPAPVQNTVPRPADLRGTKGAPLAVEITNAADLQPGARLASPGQGVAHRRLLPFLGWVLAVIALIQLVVFSIQAMLLKRTVARLDATAEQQLRAYISVTPDNVTAWDQPENLAILFHIENHGQTVGSEIHYDYGIEIMDRLPSDAIMPATTDRLAVNNALFPREKRSVRLEFKRTGTAAEVTDVETDVKRLYIWGTLFYRDTFGKQRTTGFSFSAGGAAFAQTQRGTRGTLTAWQWEIGPRHNEAT